MWGFLSLTFLCWLSHSLFFVIPRLSLGLYLILCYKITPLTGTHLGFWGFIDIWGLVFLSLKILIIYILLFSMKKLFYQNLTLLINLFGLLYIFCSLVFLVNNWLLFYICFELSIPPILLIIIGWGNKPERLNATTYLFIYTMIGSLPLLFLSLASKVIVVDLSSKNRTSNFSKFYSFSEPNSIWLFWCLGFLIKTPIFGLHLWLPKAHVEAPVGGSIFLAAVLLKLGTYGLIRLKNLISLCDGLVLNFLIIWICFTTIYSGLICFRRTDEKSLIAYSSVLHMGIGTMGIFLLTDLRCEAMLFLSLGHGFTSSGLFFVVNLFYTKSKSRKLLLKGGYNYFNSFYIFWWFLFLSLKSSAPTSLALFSEVYLSYILSSLFLPFCFILGVCVFIGGLFSIFLYLKNCKGNTPLVSLNSSLSFRDNLISFFLCTLSFFSFFLFYFFI